MTNKEISRSPNKQQPSWQVFFANTAVFLITLAVGLLLAEAFLRVKNSDQKNYNIEMWRYAKSLKVISSDPELGHEHRPSSHAKLQNVDIRINSRGLRGAEITPLEAGQKRILLIGSSNTLAWGVSEKDSMAQKLSGNLGDRYQVLNAGIGNYNARRYVKLFESKLLDLKPDIVVVHYFIRDAETLETGGGNFLLRNSELAVTLHQLLHSLSFSDKDPTKLVDHYRAMYAEGNPGRTHMEASLKRLNELSHQNNFKVILAMVPDIHAIKPYPFSFIHDHMKKIAAKLGWSYVDFGPSLEGIPQEELWAMPGDPHLNAKGQQIMAESLSGIISQI